MQNEQFAKTMFDFLMPQVEQERCATRNVVEAVPAGKSSYAPDPVSKNALDLAWHLLSSEIWFLDCITKGNFNQPEPERPASIATPADILAWYDQAVAASTAAVKALPLEKLAEELDFFGMMKAPAAVYLQFHIKHAVHHRGQLSAYLRAMGSKVPSIYGGSADFPFEMPAAQQG